MLHKKSTSLSVDGENTSITRYIFHKFQECETALESRIFQFYNQNICPQYSILPRPPGFFKIKDISKDKDNE